MTNSECLPRIRPPRRSPILAAYARRSARPTMDDVNRISDRPARKRKPNRSRPGGAGDPSHAGSWRSRNQAAQVTDLAPAATVRLSHAGWPHHTGFLPSQRKDGSTFQVGCLIDRESGFQAGSPGIMRSSRTFRVSVSEPLPNINNPSAHAKHDIPHKNPGGCFLQSAGRPSLAWRGGRREVAGGIRKRDRAATVSLRLSGDGRKGDGQSGSGSRRTEA